MCQLKINFPSNFVTEEVSDSLEIESVPVCGTCKNRDWCPVFIISIKGLTNSILRMYPNKTDAIVKILFNKAQAQETNEFQYVMVYNGILDMIKNNDNSIEPLDIDEGKSFMKDTFKNKDILLTVKQLMANNTLKEIK